MPARARGAALWSEKNSVHEHAARLSDQRDGKKGTDMQTVKVVILTCSCGMLPLDQAMHANPRDAWNVAAEHVKLNPTLCHPRMNYDFVPAALAPAPKARD